MLNHIMECLIKRRLIMSINTCISKNEHKTWKNK